MNFTAYWQERNKYYFQGLIINVQLVVSEKFFKKLSMNTILKMCFNLHVGEKN